MSQIINLDSYYHLVVILILIIVLWILAYDLELFKSDKKEGMDFSPAHEMRFLSLSTSPTSGASMNPYRYDKFVY
jgi:hypothetical protein